MAKRKNSDRYTFEFPPGMLPELKSRAEAAGERFNSFVLRCLSDHLRLKIPDEQISPPRGRPPEADRKPAPKKKPK